MLDMIPLLRDIWHNKREEVLQSSDKILELLQQQNRIPRGGDLDEEILHRAFHDLSERYDSNAIDQGGES